MGLMKRKVLFTPAILSDRLELKDILDKVSIKGGAGTYAPNAAFIFVFFSFGMCPSHLTPQRQTCLVGTGH